MAPELLREGLYSAAADVYAFGIMLWEMVTGESAYQNMTYGELRFTVTSTRRAANLSRHAYVFAIMVPPWLLPGHS